MNLGLDGRQARARERGGVFGRARSRGAQEEPDELFQVLTLEVAAEAGDFAGAVIQLRPDRVIQSTEQVSHGERFLIRRKPKLIVLNPRQGHGIEQPIERGALQVEHRIVPRIIDALRVAQTADAVQRRQPLDRQLVQQRRRQLEVVLLEREIAKQVERLALFVGRDRLVRNPAIRVADVVAMMINAGDEFGGREQPVVVFVQPAAQRATEDLIAFTRFGESGFHRGPKLADDFKAPAEVG